MFVSPSKSVSTVNFVEQTRLSLSWWKISLRETSISGPGWQGQQNLASHLGFILLFYLEPLTSRYCVYPYFVCLSNQSLDGSRKECSFKGSLFLLGTKKHYLPSGFGKKATVVITPPYHLFVYVLPLILPHLHFLILSRPMDRLILLSAKILWSCTQLGIFSPTTLAKFLSRFKHLPPARCFTI
jgi:hypothetical protein